MKVFVLGVGAQKAGTTWLHDYLSSLPGADFGLMKEYHVLDSLYLDAFSAQRRDAIERPVQRILNRPMVPAHRHRAIQRLAFVNDPDLYFAYFCYLLQRPGTTITGDITPSYSGLPAERLAFLRDGLARSGVAVKPIFLMRDPVERLQSMVRMEFRNGGIRPDRAQEVARMRDALAAPTTTLRGNYAATLGALDEAFGEAVHLGFYETLFEESSVRAICDFLGADFAAPEFDHRLNESRTANDLTHAERLDFAHHHVGVIEACRARFGAELIDSIWPSARLLSQG